MLLTALRVDSSLQTGAAFGWQMQTALVFGPKDY